MDEPIEQSKPRNHYTSVWLIQKDIFCWYGWYKEPFCHHHSAKAKAAKTIITTRTDLMTKLMIASGTRLAHQDTVVGFTEWRFTQDTHNIVHLWYSGRVDVHKFGPQLSAIGKLDETLLFFSIDLEGNLNEMKYNTYASWLWICMELKLVSGHANPYRLSKDIGTISHWHS